MPDKMWAKSAKDYKPLDTANMPNQTIGWPNSEPPAEERIKAIQRRVKKSQTINEEQDAHDE